MDAWPFHHIGTLCFKVSFSDAWARVWIKHQLVAMCCIYSLYHENPLAIYPIHSVTVFKLWQYNSLCVDSCGRVRLWHRSRVLRRCLAAWNFDKHLVNSDCCWGFVVYAQIGSKYSHLAHILASLTLCLALPCMKWTCLVLGPVRFAEKTNRNTVPVDLLWEKNTVPTEKTS